MGIINLDEDKVLLVGGMGVGVVKGECFVFDFTSLNIATSLFQLPSEIGFSEKNMISDDGQIFFGFSYGSDKLLRINVETLKTGEMWINFT